MIISQQIYKQRKKKSFPYEDTWTV
jgi:hypothetical protein